MLVVSSSAAQCRAAVVVHDVDQNKPSAAVAALDFLAAPVHEFPALSGDFVKLLCLWNEFHL